MDHPPTTLGLTVNLTKPGAAELAARLEADFLARGLRIRFEHDTAKSLGKRDGLPLEELSAASDVLIVLGGDGTLLRVAAQLGADVKPLAAINTGRLGFLSTATQDDIERFTEAIASGAFRLSQRSVVEAAFENRHGEELKFNALNEVTITRGAISRLIRLEARIGGEFLNLYSGDGLIVATPTGSTAYSLSAGGPLVNPEAGVFLITPICPHAMANRAFVVNDDATIEVQPVEHHEEILLTADGGPPQILKRNDVVRLRRASHTVPLVMMNGASFYSILQNKLRWLGSSV